MKLYQARTKQEQKAWIRQALLDGHTLTDPDLWVAGVDDPARLIRELRREGLAVQTQKYSVRDAAGVSHLVPCWSTVRGTS